MKRVLFITGPREVRQRVTEDVMSKANPGVNEVRADLVSMDRFDTGDTAADARSAKNLFRSCMSNSRGVVVVSNDSPRESDLTAFVKIADAVEPGSVFYCLNLWEDDRYSNSRIVLLDSSADVPVIFD